MVDIDHDIDGSRHLTPQIFLSSEAFTFRSFSGPFSRRRFSLGFFPLQRPHLWNCYSPSGEWNGLKPVCQPPCSRLIASVASVANLHLKPCLLDSPFLIENLPFSPTTPLLRPPPSAKPRPEVRMRRSRLWRVVSSFHILSLHRLGITA